MARTIVDYKEGMQFAGNGDSGHRVTMDASPQVGGRDSAARPVEVMLCALGGCTGMDVLSILRKMKTEPEALRIVVDDERAPEHPKSFRKLHITYSLKGDVPPENAEKAIDLSLAKYCPIATTLAGVVEITSEFAVDKAK